MYTDISGIAIFYTVVYSVVHSMPINDTASNTTIVDNPVDVSIDTGMHIALQAFISIAPVLGIFCCYMIARIVCKE